VLASKVSNTGSTALLVGFPKLAFKASDMRSIPIWYRFVPFTSFYLSVFSSQLGYFQKSQVIAFQ
jgi:hypothetical protein